MATHRPNAAIYQEYKTLSFTPATPTLHTVIVGPCYQILDYLDDKDDCLVDDDYGVLEEDCPVTTTPALVIADPPNILPGAILDDDSVSVFFDEGRATVCGWSGADPATFLAGNNLFKAGTDHFGELGVQAGDRLIVNPLAPATEDYKNTVKELAYTLTIAACTFVTDGVTSGDLLTISGDVAATPRNGTYAVKRVVDETHLEIEDDDTFTGASANANIVITNAAGTTTKKSLIATLVVDTCYLRITDDFATANDAANRQWRIEREFHDTELLSTDFAVDSTTKVITVKAGVTVDLGDAAPLLAKAVTYAKAYVEYRALRRDLQQINEVSQDTAVMAALLGKLDARNPLHVGAYVAALNTLTTVKVFGLKSDDVSGYMDFVSKISNERLIYAVVPLTYDTTVLGFLNTMAMTLADPDYVLTNGIRQKFRVVLGAIDLPMFKYVVDPTDKVTTSHVAGTKPLSKGRRTLTFAKVLGAYVAPLFITGNNVIPGDKVVFVHGATTYSYVVAHVNGELILEVDPDGIELEAAYAYGAGDTFKVTDSTGLVNRFGPITYAAGVTTFTLASAVLDDLFLFITVPGATFVTDGVLPGDLLQMSSDPMTFAFTTYNSWVVDDVISETRIQVMNEGTDTPTVENELPHEGWRGGGKIVTQGSMYVRVIRYYTAAQQVTEMLATAHSFSSRRLVLCYPYQLEIADLKDGSLDRGTETDPIDALPDQPGYYLACAVGGQTSGQPSQQGFTFMGINGVRRIYGSNDYFSEERLTELSNGGIYVFTQESLAALPSTIHEVTTDVSTLEFSEYMCIKNFDYVAWTFLDIILEFIGKWNVTEETIQFLGQAEQSGIETLKSQRKPKIGAPLIDASIVSNEISSISTDRIESYIDVNMPMTLNTIGCHLVA